MERPKSCTDEHIKYLDTLSNSKITNMKGAGEYLVRELKLDKYKAREILSYWMKLRKEHP
jgi:hypothetical protein